eukprot:scaffold7068_cov301-Pinguiococcus_pyrenoidosus.AAC.11
MGKAEEDPGTTRGLPGKYCTLFRSNLLYNSERFPKIINNTRRIESVHTFPPGSAGGWEAIAQARIGPAISPGRVGRGAATGTREAALWR